MKPRTITLTDRRPVTIDEDEWPFVVQLERAYPAEDKPACKPRSARLCKLKLRQHADGRVIVYGTEQEAYPAQGKLEWGPLRRPVGYYLADYSDPSSGTVQASARVMIPSAPSDRAIVTAIQQVAHELGAPELAPLAIAALPAERI